MTVREIKKAMAAKGIEPGDLVRRFRKSPTAITFLIQKRLRSEKLERRFAAVLGVSLEEYRSPKSLKRGSNGN